MRLIALFFFCCIIYSCGNRQPVNLQAVKAFDNYPSGSALEYMGNRLYLMGDDAGYMLILDTAFNQVDTLLFTTTAEKRIPKDIKKDPEALAVIRYNGVPYLFLAGSGSGEHRNDSWLIDPVSRQKTVIPLDTFSNRLKQAGIRDLNVEGVTAGPTGIIIGCRGNNAYPQNHLVFTSMDFFAHQADAPVSITRVGVQTDTAVFAGLSGLEYAPVADYLLITLSTENTASVTADGAIGKSYLWLVKDISAKQGYAGINPNTIIDLQTVDKRFEKQKIESVCVFDEKHRRMNLVMVSDDDAGHSSLFRLQVNTSELFRK